MLLRISQFPPTHPPQHTARTHAHTQHTHARTHTHTHTHFAHGTARVGVVMLFVARVQRLLQSDESNRFLRVIAPPQLPPPPSPNHPLLSSVSRDHGTFLLPSTAVGESCTLPPSLPPLPHSSPHLSSLDPHCPSWTGLTRPLLWLYRDGRSRRRAEGERMDPTMASTAGRAWGWGGGEP